MPINGLARCRARQWQVGSGECRFGARSGEATTPNSGTVVPVCIDNHLEAPTQTWLPTERCPDDVSRTAAFTPGTPDALSAMPDVLIERGGGVQSAVACFSTPTSPAHAIPRRTGDIETQLAPAPGCVVATPGLGKVVEVMQRVAQEDGHWCNAETSALAIPVAGRLASNSTMVARR